MQALNCTYVETCINDGGEAPKPWSRGLQRWAEESELSATLTSLANDRNVHFSHDLASVHLHCRFANFDLRGNPLVEATLQDLGHHFALTGGSVSKRSRSAASALSLSRRAIAFKGRRKLSAAKRTASG
jgi:hypothetical protein